MSRRFPLFACVALALILLGGNQASEEKKDGNRTGRQTIEDLLYDPYGIEAEVPLYYQATPRIGGFASEVRSHYRNPLRFPFYKDYDEEIQPQARLNGLGAAAINNFLFNNRFSNNRVRPLAAFNNYVPVQWNPNFPNLANTFDSCTAPSGESGICAPGSVCSVFGGRPSGSCGLGGVCCINAVTTCGSTITLNNTYWQSPTTAVASGSTCAVTVRVDQTLKEQKRPICQIRLDMISFSTNQPNTEGQCNTDVFQVGGALNKAPAICGDNNNQHMYLNVPNSGVTPTDVQLMFTFGTGSGAVASRSWNIKIAMLPCGADYLAPSDCLQYFTSTSGNVFSFNWKDIAATSTRQLANQDYFICFRNELVSNQRASTFCVAACTVTNSGNPFLLTGSGTTAQSLADPTTTANLYSSSPTFNPCKNDFISIIGGYDPAITATTATSYYANSNDRFCGGALNVVPGGSAKTVCTTTTSFRIYYHTNNDESTGPATYPTGVTADANNVGFCLSYTLRSS